MEKSNGKIAIAIVAMFVVALSIVGFTYAYFVANVEGNELTNVTVTSGKLVIEYDDTRSIDVDGIAPNWKSDGLHYFNSTTGCTTGADGKQHCVAQKGASTDAVAGKMGVHDAATFNVSAANEENTGTVNYVVLLNGISSDFADADRTNLTYALCIGTCPETQGAADVKADYAGLTVEANATETGKVIGKGTLAPVDTTVQVISAVQTLTDGANRDYELMVYYADSGAAQDSKGKTTHADIDVIGVQQDTAGNWVDANGVIVIPKTGA